MRTYFFKRDQWFPDPIEKVFAFFTDAHNLERITPPSLHFRILTPRPIEMQQGTLIDYRLRLYGIPLRWQSEITVWEPPHRFVDQQRRGPYKLWIHRHIFKPHDDGTLVQDEIEYASRGGALIQKLLIAPDLTKIFDYRRRKLQEISDNSQFIVKSP